MDVASNENVEVKEVNNAVKSSPKLYCKPTPLGADFTPTEKQIHDCLQTLHEMEMEILELRQVILF